MTSEIDKQRIRNDSMRSFLKSGQRVNVMKISPNHPSLDHEIAKFKIARSLIEQGHQVVIEAELKEGEGRVDIFDLDTETAHEILASETVEDCEKKVAKYKGEMFFKFHKIVTKK